MDHKSKIPPPEVRHEKGITFKADLNVQAITLIVGGKLLLDNANLKLTRGRKYGLVGRNGIGKTCLINAISRGEIENFPEDIHSLQVEQETEPDEVSVLNHVLNCDVERLDLLAEFEELSKPDEEGLDPKEKTRRAVRLTEVVDRMDVIEVNEAPMKAINILTGIGFSNEDLPRACRDFSGGWRMRITIAKAIYCEPEILCLDEPTNHLDIPALIWLENYIEKLDVCVLIVSHARDFLDSVCDEIIHFQAQKLNYYKGNYTTFERVKAEKDMVATKARDKQQTEIAHIQEFINKFRANAKRATLVQSRIKAIERID